MQSKTDLPIYLKIKKLAGNPHFWILIIITSIIISIYFLWYIMYFRPDWLWYLIVMEVGHSMNGILFCIPIIYASAAFRWNGVLIMWLISMIFAIPIIIIYKTDPLKIFSNVLYICIPLLVMGYITLEINWRNKERQTLMDREQERQIYLTKVLEAQEEERKRIAREIHDDSIHSLLILANSVEANIDETATKEVLQSAVTSLKDGILNVSDELRRLAFDLRPGILDDIGFVPAIRSIVDRVNQEGRINTDMQVIGEERHLPKGIDVTLLRIVQEAITNIRLHSEAKNANLILKFYDSSVELTISDNGRGFIFPERIGILSSYGKLGLIGMYERAYSIKSTINIQSKPGHGTSICIKTRL